MAEPETEDIEVRDVVLLTCEDSIEASTSLKETIAENDLQVTHNINPQSSKESIKEAKSVAAKRAAILVIFYATNNKSFETFCHPFTEIAKSVLLVTYKMKETSLPDALKQFTILDYEDKDFTTKFLTILKGMPNNEVVYFTMYIEVHLIRGRNRNNKTQDMRKIRDTIKSLLQEPSSCLAETLRKDYKIFIINVLSNPFKFMGYVDGRWDALKQDCEESRLARVFMDQVKTKVGVMPYEVRLVLQRDDKKQQETLPMKQQVISNIIFDIIKDKDFTAFDFYTKLRGMRGKTDLSTIRSDPDGYNPLHAIIVYNRPALLMPLIHLKLFPVYLAVSVPDTSPSSYRSHTVRQIAESKRAKRYKESLDDCERLQESMSKFLNFCHAGDIDNVRILLEDLPRVKEDKDCQNNNALYWAIVSDNLQLFSLILGKGVDANNLNDKRENLLHVACMLGHSQFIHTLIHQCKMDAAQQHNNKRSPLDLVAENGDVESLKEMLQCGLHVTASMLPYAANNNRLPFIKYMLEESKQRIDIDSRDTMGRSALIKASECGHRSVFDYLISKGASIYAEDQRKRTALYMACDGGHSDLVEILLKKQTDYNCRDHYTGAELCFLIRGKDKGRKAWHYVEVRRNVVHVFLKRTRAGQVDVALYGTVVKSGWGEDPDKTTIEWVERLFVERRHRDTLEQDMTPLHIAIYKQHPKVAKILIKTEKFDLEATDSFGLTPFMMCALRNDTETAAVLEAKGVDIMAKDKEGKTALDIAEMNEQSEMINYVKGKVYFEQVEKYVEEVKKKMADELTRSHLEHLRAEGKDVRRNIIDAVRDLQISSNLLLMNLGSGPIMKASNNDTSQSSDTTTQAVMPSD